MDFFNTELGVILQRIIFVVLGAAALNYIIKKAISDYQKTGVKGIVNEIVIAVLVIGAVVFLFNTGLTETWSILMKILSFILHLLGLVLDYVMGS